MAYQIDMNLKKQVGRYNVSYTLIFGGKVLRRTTGVYADSVDEAKRKCIDLLEATQKFEITKVKRLPRDLDFSTKQQDQKRLIEEGEKEEKRWKKPSLWRRFLYWLNGTSWA